MFQFLLISWTITSVALTAPSNTASDNPTNNENNRELVGHKSFGSSSFGFSNGQQHSSSSSFSSTAEHHETSGTQTSFGSGFEGTLQHSKDEEQGGRIGQESFGGRLSSVGEPTFGGGLGSVDRKDGFDNSEQRSFDTGIAGGVNHVATTNGKHTSAVYSAATQHAYSNSKEAIATGGFHGGSESKNSFTGGLRRTNGGADVQNSFAETSFGGSSGGEIGGVQQTFDGESEGTYGRGGFSGNKMTSFSAGFGGGLQHETSNKKHLSAGIGGAMQHSYFDSKGALGGNSAAGFTGGFGGGLQESYSGGLRRSNGGENLQNSFPGEFESSFGRLSGGIIGAQSFGGGLDGKDRRGGFDGNEQISFGAGFGGSLEHGTKINGIPSSAGFGGAIQHLYSGEQQSSDIGLGGGTGHPHRGLGIFGGIKGGFGTGLHLLKHVAGTFTGGIGKVFGGVLHLHSNIQ